MVTSNVRQRYQASFPELKRVKKLPICQKDICLFLQLCSNSLTYSPNSPFLHIQCFHLEQREVILAFRHEQSPPNATNQQQSGPDLLVSSGRPKRDPNHSFICNSPWGLSNPPFSHRSLPFTQYPPSPLSLPTSLTMHPFPHPTSNIETYKIGAEGGHSSQHCHSL